MPRARRRWTMEIDEAAPRIAEAMLAMVRQFPGSPPPLQRHYRTVLKAMARDLENFVRPMASAAAQAKAREMGLPDIRDFHWHDQPRKMGDPRRSIFHWEHVVPVENIVDRVLKQTTAEGIADVLRTAQVSWILKDENRELTHRGRSDPAGDYRRAGIVIE